MNREKKDDGKLQRLWNDRDDPPGFPETHDILKLLDNFWWAVLQAEDMQITVLWAEAIHPVDAVGLESTLAGRVGRCKIGVTEEETPIADAARLAPGRRVREIHPIDVELP